MIDLNKYQEFVAAVTSQPSNDLTTFMNRMDQLDGNFDSVSNTHGPDINVPLLITACFGLAAESGEFIEIPKKILFQGKPLTDAEVFHLKRELGDIAWYFAQACTGLDTSIEEVLIMNVEKLSARYPQGFEIIKSEIRKEGDI